ncbi:MAG: 6-phosphogluconolactonase [bacterium]|nr:6-phosphogluconolactonase [bacterium]
MPQHIPIQVCEDEQAILDALFSPEQSGEQQDELRLLGFSGGSIVQVFAEYRERMIEAAQAGGWRIFLVDERQVPVEDPDSNCGQFMRKVFREAGIFHLHSIRSDLDLDQCAADYERRFAQACLDTERDRFDLVVMGIGPDGHCASLFPNHDSGRFAIQSKDQAGASAVVPDAGGIVIPVRNAPKPPPNRISFSGPALAAAKRIRFLVRGEAKRDLIEMLRSDPEAYPAGRLLCKHPDAKILADPAAAS